ncbi:MAG: Eco29kI family restriction endonuclease [Desulfococcaceae bacterium]
MGIEKPPRITPFNPLDKKNLGVGVAEAMLDEPVRTLPPDPFPGAGIYAIYLIGAFPAYRQISAKNRDEKWDWPIYAGKAAPAGARKGGFGLGKDPGQVLFQGLKKHATSIESAKKP